MLIIRLAVSGTYIPPTAFEKALTHLKKWGSSSFHPQNRDFDAIQSNWANVLRYLTSLDLESYNPNPKQTLTVPKTKRDFRITTLLHPIDALIMTAFVYDTGNIIEQSRIPKEEEVVYSNRFQPDAKGNIYDQKISWQAWHDNSYELASSGNFPYILMTDISDFYNHLYLHRVENSLTHAGVQREYSKAIENFFLKLNGRKSIGLPVGPSASHLIAEACLTDIDQYLIPRVRFTRYVDDYRIFCSSKDEAVMILDDLSKRLYEMHRLTLNNRKTKLLTHEYFMQHYGFTDDEYLEYVKVRATEKRIMELTIIETHEVEDSYGHPVYIEEQIILEEQNSIEQGELRKAIRAFAESALTSKSRETRMLRFATTRAAIIRSDCISNLIAENLEKCIYFLPDAVKYLSIVASRLTAKDHEAIFEFFNTSSYRSNSHVRHWILTLALNLYIKLADSRYSSYIRESSWNEAIRYNFFIAKAMGDRGFVVAHRENWRNLSDDSRSSFIESSEVLSSTEKSMFLKEVLDSQSLMDNSYGMLIKS